MLGYPPMDPQHVRQRLRFILIGLASLIPWTIATLLLASHLGLAIALYVIGAILWGVSLYGLVLRYYLKRSARAELRATPTESQRRAERILPIILGGVAAFLLFEGATASTLFLSAWAYASGAIFIGMGLYYGLRPWYLKTTPRAEAATREEATATKAAVTGGAIAVTGSILFFILAYLAGPVPLGFVSLGFAVVMLGLAIFFEVCYLRGLDPYRRLRHRLSATPP